MQSIEECLLMYRHTLRRLLFEAGIPSNPGVTDDWILEEISKLVKLSIDSFATDKPEISQLKRMIVEIFAVAGIESFVPPLKRRGYVFLREPADSQCLAFIAEHFGKPVKDGVVISSCGFGDWKLIKSAVETYKSALDEQNVECAILAFEHEWNFAAYVFIPLQP